MLSYLMHRLMHIDVVVRRNLRNIEMLSVGLTGRRTSSLCSGYVVRWRSARVKRLFLVRLQKKKRNKSANQNSIASVQQQVGNTVYCVNGWNLKPYIDFI